MSNIQVPGGRGLPFTGFATLPLVLVGLVLSLLGGLMALVRPRSKATQRES